MKKIQYTILFVCSIILLMSCGKKEEEVKKAPRPIKYKEVYMSGGEQQRTFSGTTRDANSAKLSFRANGLLLKLYAKVGEKVRKGQLLAQLDAKDQSLSYQQAKASLEGAKVQMETALSTLNRTKRLYQSNNVALSEYEGARNNYTSAVANHETAKKTLSLQASQIEYTKIYAPSSGIIAGKSVDENEVVQAGQVIYTFNEGKEMEVKVNVPDVYIRRMKEGQEAEVVLTALPDKAKFKAVIKEVSFVSEGTSTTYPVKLKVLKSTDRILSGMAAEVTFEFGKSDEPEKLIVPFEAVGEDDTQGNFVLLISSEKETPVVKKIYIEVGEKVGDGFVIKSGLNAGDKVAVAGLHLLIDGQEVKL